MIAVACNGCADKQAVVSADAMRVSSTNLIRGYKVSVVW